MKKTLIIGLLAIGGYYLYKKSNKPKGGASSDDKTKAAATKDVLDSEKYFNEVNEDYNIKFAEWNRLVDLRWKSATGTNIDNMYLYKPTIDAAIKLRNDAIADLDSKRAVLKKLYGIGSLKSNKIALGGM